MAGTFLITLVLRVQGLQAGVAAGMLRLRVMLQDTCRDLAQVHTAGLPGPVRVHPQARARRCDRPRPVCAGLVQGKPKVVAPMAGRRWRQACAVVGMVLAAPGAMAACTGLAQPLLPLAPGVWWLPSATGDSNPDNRGRVSNLVVVRQGQGARARWWAVGSGPSPALGLALACQVRQQLGGAVTDVISPWARPELVLGVAGLREAARREGGPAQPLIRHWAHASVAAAMAAQCPHCVERLQQRLGPAAADLGADPISLPDHLLQGEQGRLGPFDWWRLPRSAGRWATVWRLAAPGQPVLWLAPGLLQGAGPPDGRDAELALLQQANAGLAVLVAADRAANPGGLRLVGEQGPLLAADAPTQHARYWADLLAAAQTAVLRGDDETAAAPAWPGLPPGWANQPWHALNWQRAWRQAESALLAPPPGPAPVTGPGGGRVAASVAAPVAAPLPAASAP